MAPLPEVHRRLLQPLNETGIRYMVTGGLAAIVYGEPRLTNDVDVVVELSTADAARLTAAFDETQYYLPPIEVIRSEAARVAFGHFNVVHRESALRADIYCVGEDEFGAWAFARRRSVQLADDSLWLAPIEYVMLQKLRYYRDSGSERHMSDIAAMRRISGDLVDEVALEEWINRLGLQAEWRMVPSG